MKLIYIAGKFRGQTPWAVEQNVRRAEEAGHAVAHLGGMPVIPHTMLRFFDRQCTDLFWLMGTSSLLRQCDAVLFLWDWQFSEGAQHAFLVAAEKKLPQFYQISAVDYDLAELRIWLNQYRCGEYCVTDADMKRIGIARARTGTYLDLKKSGK